MGLVFSDVKKGQPNRPGQASADLGLAGPASARPAEPEKNYLFLYFLKHYLS
jgi:hypothetical protein